MALEIYYYLPAQLLPQQLYESDFHEFIELYAKAKYLKEMEVHNLQRAVVQAFGE